jgi:very-short-patch-repair endonuclease
MDREQALAAAGPSAALSHEEAAKALGIELVEGGRRRLTVPRNRSRVRVPGWDVVRSDLRPREVEEVDGVRTTTALRTVPNLCRVLVFAHAVVAANSALVTASELRAALAGARGRGACRLRAVAPALDPASGSVLESLLRVLLRSAGLGPVTQFVVDDARGRFVARVDFCWPAARLVVEADGFAFHADRASYRRDRERLNDLERCGWRVLRFTWEDVVHRPDHVLAVVRDCLAQRAA